MYSDKERIVNEIYNDRCDSLANSWIELRKNEFEMMQFNGTGVAVLE